MIQAKTEIVFKRLPEVGSDAWAVFWVILGFMFDNEHCWPGIDTIRKLATVEVVKTGEIQPMPVKRCYAAINRLVTAQMIERKQERLPNGDWDRRYFRPTEQYIQLFQSINYRKLYELPDDGLVNIGDTINGLSNIDQTDNTNSKSISSIEENAFLKKWLEDGDERIAAAKAELVEHFRTYKPSDMLAMARIKVTPEKFYEQLDAWVRYHRDVYTIINNPSRFLTGGKGNFISWLKKPWNAEKPKAAAGAETSTKSKLRIDEFETE